MARIDELLAVMATLRDPRRGCPWDREQTFATIAPYTLEEAYEVAEAIEREDYAGLKDELGDLLFQVVFHARMAEEAGLFCFDDVVAAIVEKMRRRHPHVFGDETVADAEEQTRRWEAMKAAERAESGARESSRARGLNLPALTRAAKVLRQSGRSLARSEAPDLAVLSPEARDRAVGGALMACVSDAVAAGIDPEGALRRTTRRLETGEV